MKATRFSLLQKWSESLLPDWFRRPAMMQVAALCYRRVENGHEVLLITSLGRGAWILPKGWPKKKISSAQTALEEAFEEAGIQGHVAERPVGEYAYTKTSRNGPPIECVATVYAVEVTNIAKKYPEKGERQVKWFTPEEAAKAVSSPELAALMRKFKPDN